MHEQIHRSPSTPLNSIQAKSALTPELDPLESEPDLPLQAKLERAERLGHHFSRVQVLSDPTPQPKAQLFSQAEPGVIQQQDDEESESPATLPTTLEGWKQAWQESGGEGTFQTYVMDQLGVSDETSNTVAGVGFLEGRQAGPLAVLMAGMVVMNKTQAQGQTLSQATDPFAAPPDGFTHASFLEGSIDGSLSEERNEIGYGNPETQQQEFQEAAAAAQDGTWRMMAGFELANRQPGVDPTLFLTDEESLWVQYYQRYQAELGGPGTPTPNEALEILNQIYQEQHIYYANPAGTGWLEECGGETVMQQEYRRLALRNRQAAAAVRSEGGLRSYIRRFWSGRVDTAGDADAQEAMIDTIIGELALQLNVPRDAFVSDPVGSFERYALTLEQTADNFAGMVSNGRSTVTHGGAPPFLGNTAPACSPVE